MVTVGLGVVGDGVGDGVGGGVGRALRFTWQQNCCHRILVLLDFRVDVSFSNNSCDDLKGNYVNALKRF